MTTPESPERRERVKRPEPARTRPVRGGWLDLFGAPGVSRHSGEAPDARSGAQPDPLTRAVELGYRVVDDYIRQGQNAARLFAQRTYGSKAAQQDVQDLVMRSFEYASELSAVWFDVIGMSTTGRQTASTEAAQRSQPSPGAPSARERSSPVPADGRSALAVVVDANRRVEIRTVMRPMAEGALLHLHELRSASAHLPHLDDLEISCERAGGPVTVRIRIPDDQPAGTYSGVVVDANTNVPMGTIQVRIP